MLILLNRVLRIHVPNVIVLKSSSSLGDRVKVILRTRTKKIFFCFGGVRIFKVTSIEKNWDGCFLSFLLG
ncbi:Uncharacterized protein APZ42_023202 [Daphnia magna]|uniref:Uncharacterized protein n=1 Tax=Daphnia magna TaxID=35525 RepID=A0A164V513_9CRUS|nr:Uncharacterized protein APZ42_023202 [Daphnia magna]